MVKKSRTAAQKRSSKQLNSTMPEAFTRVSASLRTIAGSRRKVPTIVLRGDWLKSLGFPVDAPIYVVASAHGRMAICRQGLHRPRWLYIVAPDASR